MRKLFILFIILSTITTFGQFRRISILEEATNASCGPCAAANPELQKFVSQNFGGVISVRYHASWPGYDPMYNHNTTENSSRISYYGISGVPTYVLNGVKKGQPGSAIGMRNEMLTDNSSGSPIWIEVTGNVVASNYEVNVKVISDAAVEGNSFYLRSAIIERRIVYASAPGSNGEKEFNDVFRKMVPNLTGESISFSTADTLEFNYAVEINRDWNLDDLAVVTWVQNESTKEIIQSNINLPTYIIESETENAAIVTENEQLEKQYSIINSNPDTLNITVLTETEMVDDWSFSMIYNETPSDSFDVTILPGDTLKFSSQLQTSTTPGSAKINVIARNNDDAYLYGYNSDFFGLLPDGEILLVDADGGKNYEDYFKLGLDSSFVDFTYIERGYLGSLSEALVNQNFSAIFWNSAWGFPAITTTDLNFLVPYLDNGGKLFISGQDIGWDIFDGSGSSNFQSAKDFYNNYLGATYINDNSSVYSMVGIDGDPIANGMSFAIRSIYSRYPEVIRANGATASAFMKYTNTSKYGGIKNDNGTFQTVYLGIGLEQVGDEIDRINLVKNSLIWFGILEPSAIEDENIVNNFELLQNYPNPFNPSTVISYSIPNNVNNEVTEVKLVVYDLLGNEAATLVNERQSAGEYEVKFDASKLTSGVYFYRLLSGDFSITKKMTLIK